MALTHTLGRETGVDTQRLSSLCELVARRAGRSFHRAKPIVGADVFRHESGIHTAALLKNSAAYQPFPCEEVGRVPEAFVVGKHSGSAGVQSLLAAGGVAVPTALCPEILSAVRRRARAQKSAVLQEELLVIARELLRQRGMSSYADLPA